MSTIKIDEQKIKSELVFNQNGIEVYRYNQPLYLYFYNNDWFYTYKTRVPRTKTTDRLFKVSCFYRIHLDDCVINELEKTNCITKWSNGKVSINDEVTLLSQLEMLTTFKADYISERYGSFEFENDTKQNININKVIFLKSDMKEIITISEKEKMLQQESSKRKIVEQLFGKQIEAITKDSKMHVAHWMDKKRIYLDGDDIQEIINEHIQNVIEKFTDLGLKATTCENRYHKYTIKIPMINIELGDDLLMKENDNDC